MQNKSEKIFLTGSSGMLGIDVLPILKEHYNIVPVSRSDLDITDENLVHEAVISERVDRVIHMAASTNLDRCEEEPAQAFNVNALGTLNIARACAKSGARLIYISTSGVFSGKLGRPYTESDIPKPANVYGKSKYKGELHVLENLAHDKVTILRVGWLFGGGKRDKKFVRKMFNLIRSNSKVFAVNDIFGSPNYSVDIGKAIVDFIKKEISGVFHIQNSGAPASRYEIATAIRDCLGSDTVVEPVLSERFPTKAFRPPMEAIKSIKIWQALGYEFRNWKDALSEYIERLKTEL